MTTYHVNAADVAQAAAVSARSGDTIRTEVAAMVAHLSSLESTWQGGAAAAFAGVLDQWRAAQAQVDVALDALSAALNNAAAEYTAAEDSVTRLFSR
jgi:WXG100 family type VII secretion target